MLSVRPSVADPDRKDPVFRPSARDGAAAGPAGVILSGVILSGVIPSGVIR